VASLLTTSLNIRSSAQYTQARRTLVIAGIAHALHDGYTDLIYVLLPVWQAEFALGYGVLAFVRGLYTGTMAGLQIPVGRLAERIGGRAILAIGTALAAGGYALAGFSGGLLGLCIALALSGAGSSTQHPIASAAVSRSYGGAARGPLGIYNFAGDLGKAAIPAATSVLLTLMPWRSALYVLVALGLLVALLVALLMPEIDRSGAPEVRKGQYAGGGRGGYPLLLAIGILDSAVRMGFLTFLPFLLKAKGATLPDIGFALSLVFIGGAAGKFACGWVGQRFGVLWTVVATEGGTALAIAAVLFSPLLPALCALPLLGVMLNGTSSVLYGTVPELAPADRTERAFALFYTGTIGSGAIAPVLFGILGDTAGITWATVATAAAAMLTIPLALLLAPRLAGTENDLVS
jgi:FSR family fosmidomycin resistance protein-like MFS transporter